jgi:hypothetical protein
VETDISRFPCVKPSLPKKARQPRLRYVEKGSGFSSPVAFFVLYALLRAIPFFRAALIS